MEAGKLYDFFVENIYPSIPFCPGEGQNTLFYTEKKIARYALEERCFTIYLTPQPQRIHRMRERERDRERERKRERKREKMRERGNPFNVRTMLFR